MFPFDMATPFWNNDIVKDSKNNFWITTSFGLFKWNGNNLRRYNYNEQDTNSISGHYISMIYEDYNKNIWVCSEGLDLYDSKNDIFIHYTQKFKALPKNSKAITQDNLGRYWVSSNEGIACMDIASGYFRHYLEEDGLQANSFIDKTVTKGNDGILYF
ncbi:MAG: hypothetical protein IPO21_05075 [Bacteroidales bacterium]|nr:hypothetical protein [Bacteroidales bacterium]